MKVIKKNNVIEEYDEQKIINACDKSAQRAMVKLNGEDYIAILNRVLEIINEEDFWVDEYNDDIISVQDMHSIVENALLELYPSVGRAYQQYRNYKLDFVSMLDDVYKRSQEIRYIGDVSNANSDSTMISTQRSLIYGQLNKNLYQKFFMTKDELQATEDGYIYIHDIKDRLDGFNCDLFDVGSVLRGGFEMGNIWYNEPKTLDVAFDVIDDVVMSAAAQQYGGFTMARVETILAPYAEKSYEKYKNKYITRCHMTQEEAEKLAIEDVRRDMEQGFQSWEYRFNTVGSSRGDYPFISISFGIGQSRFELMASEVALEVRKNGQGKTGFKKPVLFPKLTFLYDENLHGVGKPLEWLFEKAIDCSCATMYPDYLSLTGDGYIPSMYKKYGKVVSLMG